MQRRYAYRLVNVFTDGSALSGNPLCVFEDARGLDTPTLQALALQFNLSETTFVLPSEQATARVRIFTPAFEMAFAGHPTLGTASVVAQQHAALDALTLEMQVGIIPVRKLSTSRWQLRATPASTRATAASREQLAALIGLDTGDLIDGELWVNAGREQLLVPVASREAVDRCRASAMRLDALPSARVEGMVYVFHDDGREVYARFFFPGNGSVLEDPATGSACANLGAWLLARGATGPLQRTVRQGAHVGRPSRLYLDIDAAGAVQVAGDVIEIAQGTLTLPAA